LLVSLTEEGTSIAMQTYDDVIARLQRQLGHLAPGDQRRLAAVVRELTRAGQPMPGR
jgi:hypothetical protein